MSDDDGMKTTLLACVLLLSCTVAPPSYLVVEARAPELSTVDVEAQVLAPLERALAGMPGAATTRRGSATLRLSFERAANVDAALLDVRGRTSALALPEPPLVTREPPSTLVRWTLRGPQLSPRELRQLADDVVARPLATSPHVLAVDVCGGARARTIVTIDAGRLIASRTTLLDVAAAVRAAGRIAPAELGLVAAGPHVRLVDVATIEDAAVPDPCAGDGDGTLVGGEVRVALAQRADVVASLRTLALPPAVTLEVPDAPDQQERLVVTGPDLGRLTSLAEELRRRQPSLTLVGVEQTAKWRVVVDEAVAVRRGASVALVHATARMVAAPDGFAVGDIVMRVREPVEVPIALRPDGVVTLGDVATMHVVPMPVAIVHRDGVRAVELVLPPGQPAAAVHAMVELPLGYASRVEAVR